jgi:G3E family GTPase
VVTGFLGAGKTTLIHEMIRTRRWTAPAVYVQEVAQTGLDQRLYGGDTWNVKLAAGACGCCGELHELAAALTDDLLRIDAGLMQAPQLAVFETSGLTDPCALLEDFARIQYLSKRISVPRLLTVVDARHLALNTSEFAEARAQVGAADALYLTRMRDAGRAALCLAREANATAAIVLDDDGEPLDRLAQTLRADVAVRTTLLPPLSGGHSDLQQVTFQHPGRIDPARARAALELMQRILGKSFIRMKGLLRSDRPDESISIHAVRGVVDPPRVIQAQGADDEPSTLVFFVRGTNPAAVRSLWDAVVHL